MTVLSPRLSFMLVVLLGATTACTTLQGRHAVPVGKEPAELMLADGGRTLISANLGDSTLSWIDLRSRREVARVHIPVARKDAKGEDTGDTITGTSIDESTNTLWVVSSDGQIFSVDMGDHTVKSRFQDAGKSLYYALWDPYNRRLLTSAWPPSLPKGAPQEGSTLYGFDGMHLTPVLKDRFPFLMGPIARRGPTLYWLSSIEAIYGEGDNLSAIGSFNLQTGAFQYEHKVPEGCAYDLAVPPAGPILVLDNGKQRLLEFSDNGVLETARSIGGFFMSNLTALGSRVLLAAGQRVVEYRTSAAGLSGFPVLEYPVPEGEIEGIAALPDGGVAVSVGKKNEVLLLGSDQARPFTGFQEPSD